MPGGRPSRHGLKALKGRVMVRGLASVDMRSAAAQALFAWRGELLAALGGKEHVSPQKAALIETCVRTRLFIDHVDAFLLEQHSLINRKKKSILPILRERTQLCDSLTKTLCHLGLERVEVVPSIDDYWEKKRAAQEVADEEQTQPEPPERRQPGIGSDEVHDGDDHSPNLGNEMPAEETQQ
jgi:hypothetical protein